MDLPEYLRILRRRWAWSVTMVILAVLAAVGWTNYGPTTYVSSQTLYYVDAGQDATTAQMRLNSYVSLVSSSRVTSAVQGDLGLSDSSERIAERLTAEVHPNTTIMTVTAQAPTADGARDLVAAVSRQLVLLSSTLNPATSPPSGERLITADQPGTPVAARSPAQTIALALLFGLIVGVMSALLREMSDRRVRSADQLRRLDIVDPPIVEIDDASDPMPAGQVDVGFRVLRAVALRGSGRGDVLVPQSMSHDRDDEARREQRVLVVTSCDPRRPVPGVAAALAVTLARTAARVILVAADLRPHRNSPDRAVSAPGLGDLLLDEHASVSAATQPGPLPGLWLLPAGRALAYPEDVLASEPMAAVMTTLRQTHDVVLIDAPPIGAHADALSLAETADAGILLVVVRGRTHRGHVRAALRLLESTGVPVAAIALVGPPSRHLARRPARPEVPPTSAPTVQEATAVGTADPRPAPAVVDLSERPSVAVTPSPNSREG